MAGEKAIQPRAVGVIGERLRWARTRLGLSMAEVIRRGGPSRSYQCEVELGRKTDVSAETLSRWVAAVGVTVAFARGHIPKYSEGQATGYGLAKHVTNVLTEVHPQTVWREMTALTRFREVLGLTVQAPGLTPAVVAYVLGIDIKVLHELLKGERPRVTPYLISALCHITALPKAFIKLGTLTSANEVGSYLPAVELATGKGMTPDQLYELVRRWEPPAAGGAADDSTGPNSL
jgi:transcriptional regulator with XRE-family HTH domain